MVRHLCPRRHIDRAVTGKPPEEATLRVSDDRLKPAAIGAVGSYRPSFLSAIDACLKVPPSERPQSVAQARLMLLGQEARRYLTLRGLPRRERSKGRNRSRQAREGDGSLLQQC